MYISLLKYVNYYDLYTDLWKSVLQALVSHAITFCKLRKF